MVVVGLAELLLGWRWALAAGLACHVAATLAARGMFAVGPHHLGVFALPLSVAAERDTGPSALTVGLAGWLVVRERLRSLTVVYVMGVAAASLIAATSLAGVEHLVAAGVGAWARRWEWHRVASGGRDRTWDGWKLHGGRRLREASKGDRSRR